MINSTEFQRAFTLLSEKLTRWMQDLILLLPNLLIALLILAATYFVAQMVRRLAVRILPRIPPSVTLNNLVRPQRHQLHPGFWIAYRRAVDYVSAKSEATLRVKRVLDQANILIPDPIQTLNISPGLPTPA